MLPASVGIAIPVLEGPGSVTLPAPPHEHTALKHRAGMDRVGLQRCLLISRVHACVPPIVCVESLSSRAARRMTYDLAIAEAGEGCLDAGFSVYGF